MKLTVWDNLLVLTRYSKTVTAFCNYVVSCRPTVNNSKALLHAQQTFTAYAHLQFVKVEMGAFKQK